MVLPKWLLWGPCSTFESTDCLRSTVKALFLTTSGLIVFYLSWSLNRWQNCCQRFETSIVPKTWADFYLMAQKYSPNKSLVSTHDGSILAKRYSASMTSVKARWLCCYPAFVSRFWLCLCTPRQYTGPQMMRCSFCAVSHAIAQFE